MKLSEKTRGVRFSLGALGILGFLLAWELASRLHWISPAFLPPPTAVAPSLWSILASGSFAAPLASTLWLFGLGYSIACIFGVSLGVAMGVSEPVYNLLEPLVEAIRPVPKPALIPVFVIFLGIGSGMKITTVALAAMFPVLISTLQGVRGVEPILLATAKTLGCSRVATIFKVIVPSALPMILAGMRVSLGLGLALVVLAEMLAADRGVGFLVLDLQRSFRVKEMYAWIVILACVGLVLNAVYERIESRVVPWRAR